MIWRCLQAPPEPVGGRNWLHIESHEGSKAPTVAPAEELEAFCGRCVSRIEQSQGLHFGDSKGCDAQIATRICGSPWLPVFVSSIVGYLGCCSAPSQKTMRIPLYSTLQGS